MGSAVVTLLDEAHWRRVEALWRELDREFGLRGVAVTPFPHFSYQVADGYDTEALEPVLRRAAREAAPFTVKTAGLGIFTGPQPVLYLQVVRSPALTRLHDVLWPEAARAGRGVLPYYRPESWIPHITRPTATSPGRTWGASWPGSASATSPGISPWTTWRSSTTRGRGRRSAGAFRSGAEGAGRVLSF